MSDATEAAQRRVERYASAMDDVPFTGYDGRQRQLMAYAAMAVAEREQADLVAAWKEFHDMAVAGYEDDLAELRAEVERLRELADQWERVGGFLPASQMKRLRAILGAPKDTE